MRFVILGAGCEITPVPASLRYRLHTAQQIASLVNLSRAALVHSDAINRVSLIKTMADQEGVRILPREPGDSFELLDRCRSPGGA